MIVGIGVDLVDFRRIQAATERLGERFLDRLFTQQERSYCESRRANPFATYGTTFAGKEAVLKAIGRTDGIRWHDIEIIRQPHGKPIVQLDGVALQRCMDLTSKRFTMHITLTDEPPYAQSFAVLEQQMI